MALWQAACIAAVSTENTYRKRSENANKYLSKSCYFRSRVTRIKRGFPRKVLAVDAKETTVIDLFTKQSPGTVIVFKNIFDLPF